MDKRENLQSVQYYLNIKLFPFSICAENIVASYVADQTDDPTLYVELASLTEAISWNTFTNSFYQMEFRWIRLLITTSKVGNE